MEIQWHLEEDDFFTGLPGLKDELLALSLPRDVRKGDFIFLEGDPGVSAFYLGTYRVESFLNRLEGFGNLGLASGSFREKPGSTHTMDYPASQVALFLGITTSTVVQAPGNRESGTQSRPKLVHSPTESHVPVTWACPWMWIRGGWGSTGS